MFFKRLKNKIKIKFNNFFNDLKESIKINCFYYKAYLELQYETYIRSKILKHSNRLLWKDVINIDDQRDFIYLLLILHRKLQLMEKVWGTSTNHENDYDEKEKLQDLLNILDEMISIALENRDVTKHERYQKLSRSFFNKLHRLHDKLWD